MPLNTTPPGEAEIKKWFLDVHTVPSCTFEFALVLGGTVSAGSYTAGAVDFLIEALDCFEAASPKHDVILKLITGASGGGVNAAIAARALGYSFPHVDERTAYSPHGNTKNPFYETWVRTLRLDGFLDTGDIGTALKSVLNGKPIDDGAAAIVSYEGTQRPIRRWVTDPLRIILTMTNLRGVPYKTNFGKFSQGYVDHADYARFAVLYPGQTLTDPRPDEFVLNFGLPVGAQMTSWKAFSTFAQATAAFPVGFPPRALSRPTEHYRWRVVPYPPEPTGATGYMLCWPDWEAMKTGGVVPENWEMLAVDGGATDNEPIHLARSALAGLLNRNPRDAISANRAVWLIDPFAGRAPLGPSGETLFPQQLAAVVTTLTQQTRYDSADLLMAADDKQFSRFMLTPMRGNLVGEEAIASGGLGAFIGFACAEFMHHDYMLGRQNCQRFLREEFVLAEDNKVFAAYDAQEKAAIQGAAPPGMLPIIPLYGTAARAIDPAANPWPINTLNPEWYRDSIEKRLRAIVEVELSGSAFHNALAWIGAHAIQKSVADKIIEAINGYLSKANLGMGPGSRPQ